VSGDRAFAASFSCVPQKRSVSLLRLKTQWPGEYETWKQRRLDDLEVVYIWADKLYVSCAEEPSKSFFRYRDPDTHEIITSPDKEWNVRLFALRADKLLWHAIYSETNRFSLGDVIQTPFA
jgi:hypothetical protein